MNQPAPLRRARRAQTWHYEAEGDPGVAFELRRYEEPGLATLSVRYVTISGSVSTVDLKLTPDDVEALSDLFAQAEILNP